MIKINLIREGRAAVRGASPTSASATTGGGGPSGLANYMLVAMIALGALAAGGYWFVVNRERTTKKEQVTVQRAEAAKLENIIKEVERFQRRKESLEKRIALINDLKKNQKGPVRILDRISQDLPDLVWIEKLDLKGTSVSLSGKALNPNAFANYVENIKSDPMFSEPEVSSLVEQSGGPRGGSIYQWAMTFNFTWKPPEPQKTDDGQLGVEGAVAAPAAPGI